MGMNEDAKIMGGNYTAIDNGDGTFTIKDMPIFAELPAGVRGNKKPVDKDWLDQALKTAQEKAKGQYFSPTRVNHLNDQFGNPLPTEPAGMYIPTSVRKYNLHGKTVWALFADLMRIPGKIFNEVRNLMIPYRSVEVKSWDHPELSALALTRDRSPFYEFAVTSIGKIIKKENIKNDFDSTSPVVAYAYTEDGSEAFCFNFTGGANMADEKPVVPAPEAEKKESEELTLLKEILSILKGAMEAKKPEAGKPAEQPAMAAKKPEAALEGKIQAAEDRLAKIEMAKAIESRVTGAEKSLEGYVLSPKTREILKRNAERGEEALKDFVESYKENTPLDPPKTLAEFEERQAVNTGTPSEVSKYMSQGPEKFQRARKLANEFVELNGRVSVNLERYIEIGMNRAD